MISDRWPTLSAQANCPISWIRLSTTTSTFTPPLPRESNQADARRPSVAGAPLFPQVGSSTVVPTRPHAGTIASQEVRRGRRRHVSFFRPVPSIHLLGLNALLQNCPDFWGKNQRRRRRRALRKCGSQPLRPFRCGADHRGDGRELLFRHPRRGTGCASPTTT